MAFVINYLNHIEDAPQKLSILEKKEGVKCL